MHRIRRRPLLAIASLLPFALAAMGAISGQMGIQWSIVVPLLAFAVVLGFAMSNRSVEA